MRTSIKVGKLMGIPIYLHFTFLIVIPLIAYIFAQFAPRVLIFSLGFANTPNLVLRWVFSFATALLFFSCILLHELAHSWVALSEGIRIRRIILLIFGGLASMEETPRDPRIELRMAAIGPLVSIFLGMVCAIIFLALYFFKGWVVYFQILFSILAFYNVFIACFNLLPAFPMDGGRIFRAWLATKMHYLKATKRAVALGRAFAIFMGIFGFSTALLYHSMGGLFLVLIAIIIYMGATEEEKRTIAQVTLEKVKVKDLMTINVKTVSPAMSINEFIDLMLHTKHMGYPVVDNNKLLGIVTLQDVHEVPAVERMEKKVADVMTKQIITLSPDAKATEALRLIAKHEIGRLVVVENSKLMGIVSRTDLIRSIRILRG